MDNMNTNREQIIALRKGGSPSQHRDYWTEEERQQLQDLYEEGYGISEMAIIFNRSECAIYNQIEAMGLSQKIRRPRKKSTECKCSKCNCEGCDRSPAKQE